MFKQSNVLNEAFNKNYNDLNPLLFGEIFFPHNSTVC